jgi:hypothetical protein
MTALQSLLDGLIDYAGLFPPAGLDMLTAIRNYAEYRAGDYSYALGRFVVPASRLSEFSDAFNEACCNEQGAPWLLSVIGTGDLKADMPNLAAFSEGAAFFDALEIKATDAAHAEQILTTSPSSEATYIEFASEKASEILPVLKKFKARAKIRTGGVTPDTFPSSEKVARFLISCAKEQIAFKATAGLHHPLRGTYKLTYEAESGSAHMHGFINVFVAATIAYLGAEEADVLSVLGAQKAEAFSGTSDFLTWSDWQLNPEQIRKVRRKFAISFGSCSFMEPIEELKMLGWL